MDFMNQNYQPLWWIIGPNIVVEYLSQLYLYRILQWQFKYQRMQRGRVQLLEWINWVTETQYTSIEMLGDTVAYCQILQAIHPNSININRLNINTRYPQDCIRNTKLLEDGLKKLKITQPASMEKIGRGKFQDNIIFVQWLFNYAHKNGQHALNNLNAYQRRVAILQRQNKHIDDMNTHLIPNQVYMQQEPNSHEQDYDDMDQHEEQHPLSSERNEQIDSRVKQINQYVVCLENDLKEKMELNWRMMHLVDRSIEERNSLYGLLQEIEKSLMAEPHSNVKDEVIKVLYQSPIDFL